MPKYQFRFEAIHANWPAYPAGQGVDYALETLCCFPAGTHFSSIDQIDQCVLLVAVEDISPKDISDPYSERHSHVALEEKELQGLKNLGWVEGFTTAAEFRAE